VIDLPDLLGLDGDLVAGFLEPRKVTVSAVSRPCP
jgi:hypothetical protein